MGIFELIITLPKHLLGSSPILFCPSCDTKTLHNITVAHGANIYECAKCGSHVEIELEDENE